MYSTSDPRKQQNKVVQLIVTTIVMVVVAGYAVYASGIDKIAKDLTSKLFPKAADHKAAQSHYDASMELLVNPQYLEVSAAEFGEAISADPEFADAYYQRAMLLMFFNKEEALTDFSKVVELKGDDPTYADVYYWRATTYAVNGKYEESIADYTRYINAPISELVPNPVLDTFKRHANDPIVFASSKWMAYVGRGDVYFQLDKTEDALADYDKALSMDHENTIRMLKIWMPKFQARLEILPEGKTKTKLKKIIEMAGE